MPTSGLSGFGRSGGRRAEPAQQGLRVVGEVVDAAELRDDDRLDAGPRGGRYLRVGDLAGADAFAVVFDEDVRPAAACQRDRSRDKTPGRSPSWTTPSRWVALVMATYRSLSPDAESATIRAGSATRTESNSSPRTCLTLSTTTGRSRDGSSSTTSGTPTPTARVSSSSLSAGTMTARLPDPITADSSRVSSPRNDPSSPGGAWACHGLIPVSLTGRGGCRLGSMASSTSAATSAISAGVR